MIAKLNLSCLRLNPHVLGTIDSTVASQHIAEAKFGGYDHPVLTIRLPDDITEQIAALAYKRLEIYLKAQINTFQSEQKQKQKQKQLT